MVPSRPRSSPPRDAPLLGEDGGRRVVGGDVLDEVGQFPVGVVGFVRRVHAGDVRERSKIRTRGEFFPDPPLLIRPASEGEWRTRPPFSPTELPNRKSPSPPKKNAITELEAVLRGHGGREGGGDVVGRGGAVVQPAHDRP